MLVRLKYPVLNLRWPINLMTTLICLSQARSVVLSCKKMFPVVTLVRKATDFLDLLKKTLH